MNDIQTWQQGRFVDQPQYALWTQEDKDKADEQERHLVRPAPTKNAICYCKEYADAEWIAKRLNLAATLEQMTYDYAMGKDLECGILRLEGWLMGGAKLKFQDGKWWIFDKDGDGLIGDATLAGLIKKLADQATLKVILKGAVTIAEEIGDRGYYICDTTGRWHLYDDGIVRNGAAAPVEGPTAFWPTLEAANEFYLKWKDGKEISC